MHAHLKHRRGNTRGFSLIELMVSVGLFAIVMTVSVGTLLALIDANRKAQSLKSVINNLNFSIDSMGRALRTGQTYYCHTATTVASMPQGRRSCANGSTGITFRNDANARVGFRFAGGGIERRIIDGSNDSGWIKLTAPEVQISDMRFYVTGAEAGDGIQPLITMSIRGEAGVQLATESSFNIQTTVTQRVLDR